MLPFSKNQVRYRHLHREKYYLRFFFNSIKENELTISNKYQTCTTIARQLIIRVKFFYFISVSEFNLIKT